MIKWNNIAKGLCVICDKPLETSSFNICLACKKPCEINIKQSEKTGGQYFIADIKSKCCNADIMQNQKTTCSDRCHENLVIEIENKFGKYKQVTDMTTHKTHKVPTRLIIEKGITQKDLPNFPLWNQNEQ